VLIFGVGVRPGDGSHAPSLGGHNLDGNLMPLASTAAHGPMVIKDNFGLVEVPTADMMTRS